MDRARLESGHSTLLSEFSAFPGAYCKRNDLRQNKNTYDGFKQVWTSSNKFGQFQTRMAKFNKFCQKLILEYDFCPQDGRCKPTRNFFDQLLFLSEFNLPAVITQRSEIRAPPHDILLLKNDCLITATCLNLENIEIKKTFTFKKILDLKLF